MPPDHMRGASPLTFPPDTRIPPEQFDDTFVWGCELAVDCGVPVDPREISEALPNLCVMTGSFVASAWAGRPAGSAPCVVIVQDVPRAIYALIGRFPEWRGSRSAISESPSTFRMHAGPRVMVDVQECDTPLLERVWETAHRVSDAKNNPIALTTSAESEFVLRWIAAKQAVNQESRLENLAFVYGIADNCRNMIDDELRTLGNLGDRCSATELMRVLTDVQSGTMLKFPV